MSTTLGSIEISYAQMAIGMVPLGIVILLSAVSGTTSLIY